MKHLTSYIKDAINLVMLLLLLIACSFFFHHFTQDSYYAYEPLFLGIILIISYFINRFNKHLPVFTLSFVGLYIIVYFFPLPLSSHFYCFVILFVLTLFSFYCWFTKKLSNLPEPSKVLIAVFIILHLFAVYNGFFSWADAAYYMGLLYITGHLVRSYLSSVENIPLNEDSDGHSSHSIIIHKNNRYFFGIIGTLFAFNTLFHMPGFEQALKYIIDAVTRFLRMLIYKLLTILGKWNDTIEEVEPEDLMNKPIPSQLPQNEPHPIIRILGLVLYYLVYIGIILVLLFCIYKVCKLILNEYWNRKKTVTAGKDDFAPIETVEKITRSKEKKGIHFAFTQSINERIRQKYFKRISHLQGDGYQVNPSHTPNERAVDITSEREANIYDQTEYYNLARYSEHTLTSTDWHKVKKLF